MVPAERRGETTGVGRFLDGGSGDPVESHCRFLGVDQVASLMDQAASVTPVSKKLAPSGNQAGLVRAPSRRFAWHGSMSTRFLLRIENTIEDE